MAIEAVSGLVSLKRNKNLFQLENFGIWPFFTSQRENHALSG